MSIKSKPSSVQFDPMPAGSFPARCYSVIHIGTVPVEFQGETKLVDKVRLGFEFPTETKVFKEEKGEQPYVLSIEMTLSFHQRAKLRKFIEDWQGKKLTDEVAWDFDLENIVGKDGLANVVQSESKNKAVYANIQGLTPLPKGLKCPPAVNAPFILNYNDKWDESIFETLPDFLKDKMVQSEEYAALFNEETQTNTSVAVEEKEIDLEDISF